MVTEPLIFFKQLTVSMLFAIAWLLIYDFIKCLFGVQNKVIVFILDCLLILGLSLGYVLVLYYACDGKIRGVFALSMCLGVLIYVEALRKFVEKLFIAITLPFRKIASLVFELCKKILSFFAKTIAKKLGKLYNRRVK